MKIKMFQSKKPKSSHSVRHSRKFRLPTDASRDTQSSRALNTQLLRVIEGLHDVVRAYYTRSILPHRLVSFCMARYREKQKTCCYF